MSNVYFRFVIGDENVIHSKLSAQIESRKFAYNILDTGYLMLHFIMAVFFFDVEKLSEIQDFFFQI